jgi:DNA-binding response OmpR family regulator
MRDEMEIVLIEDNEDDAERMVKFLTSQFKNPIRVIRDGAEAVEFLMFETDSRPKLILLDLVLPSVDGIEIFRIIRSEPERRKLSVIFLISSLNTKTYIESLGIHPDGYLKKPTTSDLIPTRIEYV